MLVTKAYAAKHTGSSLTPYTIERRDPGRRDVVIDRSHCGVCHTDIHFVHNDFGMSLYPLVPEHEIVGKVTAVGDDVKKFRPGDTVGVGCLVDSCRECEWCSVEVGLARAGRNQRQGGAGNGRDQRDDVPVVIKDDNVELRLAEVGELSVSFIRLQKGTDLAPALAGLPGDLCPCPHWGYLQEGRLAMKTATGEDVYEAGQVFYWPPGHALRALENVQYVDFSPTKEFAAVIRHITGGSE